MSEWQPIKTAPKDGNAVLLHVGWPWPVVGAWNEHQKEWVYVQLNTGVIDGEWHDTYFENEYTTDEATHWMPLPELPEVNND